MSSLLDSPLILPPMPGRSASSKMATPELRCEVLILLANVPRAGRTAERLEAELARVRSFVESGRRLVWSLRAAFSDHAYEAAAELAEHHPAVVHVRNCGEPGALLLDAAADPEGAAEPLARLFAAPDRPVDCVILENCFTLARADVLADHVGAVTGINGRFVNQFLSTFYARLWVGGPYYQFFESARWSFFHHHPETAEANLEERPRFVTRDTTALEAGWVGGLSTPPGVGIAGPFQPIVPDERAVAYPLWYGTNRKPVDLSDPSKGYSSERDDRVHFGICTVVVPKSHKIGSLGASFWRRLLTLGADGRLKLEPGSLQALAEEIYWAGIRAELETRAADERASVLFIHGYNVSFEYAALRAAQLGVDLKVAGIMAFFSWPSKGRLAGYLADDASIDASEGAITDFLARLVETVGGRRVHVIAHSMGNKGLLRAMNRLFDNVARRTRVQFGQIFLAAPDVDCDLFRQLASVYAKLATRTTLYVSAKDMALASSGILRDYERAGYTPPVTIVPGIDTVETSRIDLSFLGHGYFADARSLLQDMHTLLQQDAPPERRFGLTQATVDGLHYWVIGS